MTTRLDFQTLSPPEHYYHFLLGLVVPLVLYREAHDGEILMRSVGPLDRIIHEIDLPGVRLGDEEAPVVTVRGFDHPEWFDGIRVRQAAALITRRLSPRPGPSQRLLIRRDPPSAFYLTQATNRGAGSQRRSIANHAALAEALAPCVDVALEDMPLATQIQHFSSASVVIAQHGAALANMIWMQRPARVVEIMPREILEEAEQRPIRPRIFPELAACLGIDHRIVLQHGRHGPVDVGAVREAVEAA